MHTHVLDVSRNIWFPCQMASFEKSDFCREAWVAVCNVEVVLLLYMIQVDVGGGHVGVIG